MNCKLRVHIIILYFFLGWSYPLKTMATLVGLKVDSIPALRTFSRTKIVDKPKDNDVEDVKHSKSDSDIDPKYYYNLNDQLQPFFDNNLTTNTASITKDLAYELYKEEHSGLVYNSEPEDDETGQSFGITVIHQKRGLETAEAEQVKNYSRKQGHYNQTANYIKNEIIENNVSPEDLQSKEKLLTKLSKDALIILEEALTESKNRTVIFCVVLKDINNHLKKFAFYNGENPMPLSMRNKAEELGYDVIKAGQTHAEGQFLQFLLARATKLNHYTHIVGMGCSKKHCAECDALMCLLLGNNYYAVTSSVNHDKGRSDNKPTSDNIFFDEDIQENNGEIVVTLQYIKTVGFHVVLQKAAVDYNAVYDNFYLTEDLKEVITQLFPKINLSSNRFNKGLKTTEDEKKKHKLYETVITEIGKLLKVNDKKIDKIKKSELDKIKKKIKKEKSAIYNEQLVDDFIKILLDDKGLVIEE